jgi:LacI family transcriptional regulator
MKVTRKHVAAYAGVSEATVSYVVNNGPRGVTPETRARVENAIAELGYHPSDIARSLRMQRTMTIGLVVPDTANPFYGEIARTIEDFSYNQGYTVILCNSHFDSVRELDYVNLLLAKRVAGIVIIPIGSESKAIARLAETNVHTVILNREVAGFYCVATDNISGGKTATEHLIALGHKRIGCITHLAEVYSYPTRRQGYELALAEAGLSIDEQLIIEVQPNVQNGQSTALSLLTLPEPPTAIFAHDDMVALGVLSAAYQLGLRVPEDLSVVGFDDNFAAAFFTPPLTTVAHTKQMMGEEGAKILIDLIQNQDPTRLQPYCNRLPTELIERVSTAMV